eukprot:gnl/Dysnectes_brevis/1292_a1448_1561.p1 GENE.gnl/Dysnectes_brevis/1292_a1448_1561~~gnl/Dysnectes_brevis/1292_a1448_1561.p1  ORF type:complete len:433 (+),score=131.08 gnl/Dysnectes_brevis/1292_a1448_1561:36-1334(+)
MSSTHQSISSVLTFSSNDGRHSQAFTSHISTLVRNSLCDLAITLVSKRYGPAGFITTFHWPSTLGPSPQAVSTFVRSAFLTEVIPRPYSLMFVAPVLHSAQTVMLRTGPHEAPITLALRRITGFHSLRGVPILRFKPHLLQLVHLSQVDRNTLQPGSEADKAFTATLERLQLAGTAAGMPSIHIGPSDPHLRAVRDMMRRSQAAASIESDIMLALDPTQTGKPTYTRVQLRLAAIDGGNPNGPLLVGALIPSSPLSQSTLRASEPKCPEGARSFLATLARAGSSLAWLPPGLGGHDDRSDRGSRERISLLSESPVPEVSTSGAPSLTGALSPGGGATPQSSRDSIVHAASPQTASPGGFTLPEDPTLARAVAEAIKELDPRLARRRKVRRHRRRSSRGSKRSLAYDPSEYELSLGRELSAPGVDDMSAYSGW